MALESSQKIADEEHVYGQHTLRDNGGKASGPATLIHEMSHLSLLTILMKRQIKIHP